MMNVHANKIVANEFVGENISKANVDLNNLTEKGKKAFFPSNTFINLSTNIRQYIPTANGYFSVLFKANTNGYCYGTIYSNNVFNSICFYNSIEQNVYISIPVTKNTTCYIGTNTTVLKVTFIYAENEN